MKEESMSNFVRELGLAFGPSRQGQQVRTDPHLLEGSFKRIEPSRG